MLFNIPGESHGRGYIYGLERLEEQNSTFAVHATWTGAPEAPTDQHLRAVRTWRNSSGYWSENGGEEDFYTSAAAVDVMKEHLSFMAGTQGNPVSAFGFGWCWDMTWLNGPGGEVDPVYGVRWAGSSVGGPDDNLRWGIDAGDTALTGNSVNLHTYLEAVTAYNAHEPQTVTIFTTGPVDGYTGENGYQRYLKHEAVRRYVRENGGVLFDYADILNWSGAGDRNTDTWDGHVYPVGHPENTVGGTGYDRDDHGGCHITEEGALKLGKAIWWMLARMAGWEG
jgi:hypothetical protein